MKLPIQYALLYPNRFPMENNSIDFTKIGNLTFEDPDFDVFHGLKLGYDAFKIGGSMPTVYNASNEMAVSLFLEERISFLRISDLIEETMAQHKTIVNPSVEEILDTEAWCYEFIKGRC